MTFRAGIVLACVGAVAVALVWLRTEKRRAHSTTARLELRKIELEAEHARLTRQVAEHNNAAWLKQKAADHGLAVESEPVETKDEPARKTGVRKAPTKAVGKTGRT